MMRSGSEFLDSIMQAKRAEQERISEQERRAMRERALKARASAAPHALLAALSRRDRVNIIAEVKRSSPSAGAIRSDADVVATATAYEQAGAAAISVLTEPSYFGGSLDDLRRAAKSASVPLLRKDFTVSAHQIYEAAACGASAILLIVAGLARAEVLSLREIAELELGLDALVEVHTTAEFDVAIECGAKIIGVNNRNLQTLTVSLDTSRQLAAKRRTDIVLVSESGIRTPGDIGELRTLGYDAFLIGETLMRSQDPATTLRSLALAEVAR